MGWAMAAITSFAVMCIGSLLLSLLIVVVMGNAERLISYIVEDDE